MLRNFDVSTDVVGVRDQLVGIAILVTAGVILWPLGNGVLSVVIFMMAVVWLSCVVVVFGVGRLLLLTVLAVIFSLLTVVSIVVDLPRHVGRLSSKVRAWWRDPVRRGIKANQQLSHRAMRRWPSYYD